MALREFRDFRSTAWTAWDVPPHRVYSEARAGVDRRTTVAPGYWPERRVSRDGRRRVMHSQLQGGWVCFTSAQEGRRLYPPPQGWDACSYAELEALCVRAADGGPAGA